VDVKNLQQMANQTSLGCLFVAINRVKSCVSVQLKENKSAAGAGSSLNALHEDKPPGKNKANLPWQNLEIEHRLACPRPQRTNEMDEYFNDWNGEVLQTYRFNYALDVGQTLDKQTEQTGSVIQNTGEKPTTAIATLDYRSLDRESPDLIVTHRSRANKLGEPKLRLIKRPKAIETVIGNLKPDFFHLKGEIRNRLHTLQCAAGHNLRWQLRTIARKDLEPFFTSFRRNESEQYRDT
jgi:hypothetical protein